jgi:Ca2+-binding EF-hand superfamily protein
LEISNGNENITKQQFLSIPSIDANPLKDRICLIFGFTNDDASNISYKKFMYSISLFNAVERIEDKLKVAFQIQDFDNDGILSHEDLRHYIALITNKNLGKAEIKAIVDEVMNECATNPELGITPANFQEVITTTDFQSKLHIYI